MRLSIINNLSKSEKIIFSSILFVGLVVHMIMPFVDHERLPETVGHFGDQIQFNEESNNLLSGRGISNTEQGVLAQATATYPGYILFISFVRALSSSPFLSVFICQHLLIISSAYIIFIISIKKKVGIVPGFIAMIFVLFYPPFLKVSNLLIPTSLSVFLAVLGCYFLTKKLSILDSIAVGCTFAFLTLTRFTFQFSLPFFLVISIIFSVKKSTCSLLRIRWTLFSLLFFLLTLAPWYIHVSNIEGRFTPGSTRSWMMVYRFNRPEENSLDSLFTRLESSEMSYSTRDSIYKSRVIYNLTNHPSGFVRNVLYNFPVLTLNIGNGIPSRNTTYSSILGAFAIFALLSSIIKAKKRLLPAFFPEFVLTFTLLLIHLPIYGTPIHSLPIWAVLSPLIGYGTSEAFNLNKITE